MSIKNFANMLGLGGAVDVVLQAKNKNSYNALIYAAAAITSANQSRDPQRAREILTQDSRRIKWMESFPITTIDKDFVHVLNGFNENRGIMLQQTADYCKAVTEKSDAIKIMSVVCNIARSDGTIDPMEKSAISLIGRALSLPENDVEGILAQFKSAPKPAKTPGWE